MQFIARLKDALDVVESPNRIWNDELAARDLANAAAQLHNYAQQLPPVPPDELRQALSLALGDAGQRISALEASMQQAGQHKRQGQQSRKAAAAFRLVAAANIIQSCCFASRSAQLTGLPAQQLGSSAALLLGSGHKALLNAASTARALPPASLARAQLAAMDGLLRLGLMQDVLQGPGVGMDYAAQLTPPAPFCRWLGACMDVLLAARLLEGDAGSPQRQALMVLMHTFRHLDPHWTLTYTAASNRMSAHYAVLAADVDLQTKLLTLVFQALQAAGEATGLLQHTGSGSSGSSGRGASGSSSGSRSSRHDRRVAPGPATAADSQAWDHLDAVLHVLELPCLAAPLLEHMCQSGGLQTMRMAIQLVAGLPLDPPGTMPPAKLWHMHQSALSMLWCGREALAASSGEQSSRAAAMTAEEVRDMAWQMLGLLPKAAAMLRKLSAEVEAGKAAGAHGEEQGYMEATLLHLCTTWSQVFLLEWEAGAAANPRQLASWAEAADAGLRLLPLLLQLAEQEQRQPWAARRPPEHVALGGRVPQLDKMLLSCGLLMVEVCSNTAAGTCERLTDGRDWGQAAGAAPPVRPAVLATAGVAGGKAVVSSLLPLQPQLRTLHATCCRLVHWWLGLSEGQRSLVGLLSSCPEIVAACNNVYTLLHVCTEELRGERSSRTGTSSRSADAEKQNSQWHATYAAQADMLAALCSQGPRSILRSARIRPRLPIIFMEVLSLGPATVWATSIPSLVAPSLQVLLEDPAAPAGNLMKVFIQAMAGVKCCPRLAAATAASGWLPLLLSLVRQAVHGTTLSQLATFMGAAVVPLGYYMRLLAVAGAEVAAAWRAQASSDGSNSDTGSGQGEGPSNAAGALELAANSLNAAAEEAMPGLPALVAAVHVDAASLAAEGEVDEQRASTFRIELEGKLDLVERAMQQLLPLAQQVAELMQTYWQQEQQVSAAQLEGARAATKRSCAYLRCANLGVLGGSEAGQRAGSQKCSKCRTAWYCGTACSHADWRAGGHKKVCAQLALLRQREPGASQPQ